MVTEIIWPLVQIFIQAYNSIEKWFLILFHVNEDGPLYKIGEIADFIYDLLPDILTTGVIGNVLNALITIGTRPLIVAIFGVTLIACITWSIIKFIIK